MYMTSEVMLTQNQGYEYGLTVKYSAPVDTVSENVYPSDYILYQNYPNPFNASTSFEFELPRNSFVNISVYNTLGQKVAVIINDNFEKGYHYYNWNAPGLSSGIYFYIFRAGDYSVIKKMAASPFLCGNNKQGWRASFDFILEAGNAVRIFA